MKPKLIERYSAERISIGILNIDDYEDVRVKGIGNEIYERIKLARNELFRQGELAQLTSLSFQETVERIRTGEEESIELSYPVGYRPDKSVIPSTYNYSKDELIGRYQDLGERQLAINGIYQLVTIMECAIGDLLRIVLKEFPQKLGSKRTVSTGLVLAATSIEEIHIKAIDTVLNEMAYKSPKEFADNIADLMSINLLECPSYHRYIETKAARDIYIHSRGIANDIYVSKSGSHARVSSGHHLPINTIYFLESFEYCLQITEWLEKNLHAVWHSSEYQEYLDKKAENLNTQKNENTGQSGSDKSK